MAGGHGWGPCCRRVLDPPVRCAPFDLMASVGKAPLVGGPRGCIFWVPGSRDLGFVFVRLKGASFGGTGGRVALVRQRGRPAACLRPNDMCEWWVRLSLFGRQSGGSGQWARRHRSNGCRCAGACVSSRPCGGRGENPWSGRFQTRRWRQYVVVSFLEAPSSEQGPLLLVTRVSSVDGGFFSPCVESMHRRWCS